MKQAVHKSKHIIDPYADSEDSFSEEERADLVNGNKESDDKVVSDNNYQKCNIERYDLYKQTKNGKRRRTRSFESSDSDGEFESLRQKAPPRENIIKKRLEAIKATMLDSCDEDDYDEFADATLVSDLPRSWTLDVRYASRIKPFKITVRPNSAVNDIMEAIGKDIGIETKSVSVKWRNKVLGQWRTLDRIPGFTQSDILEAELRHQRCSLNSKPHKENSRLTKQSPSSGPSVSINVKSDSNKVLVNFTTLLTSTIEAVRLYVAESELVDIASVLLSFEGEALNDRQTLSVLGLEAGEEVQFEARILGS